MPIIKSWLQLYFICRPQYTAPSRAFAVYNINYPHTVFGMVCARENIGIGFFVAPAIPCVVIAASIRQITAVGYAFYSNFIPVYLLVTKHVTVTGC